jgi:hypothetical protein
VAAAVAQEMGTGGTLQIVPLMTGKSAVTPKERGRAIVMVAPWQNRDVSEADDEGDSQVREGR